MFQLLIILGTEFGFFIACSILTYYYTKRKGSIYGQGFSSNVNQGQGTFLSDVLDATIDIAGEIIVFAWIMITSNLKMYHIILILLVLPIIVPLSMFLFASVLLAFLAFIELFVDLFVRFAPEIILGEIIYIFVMLILIISNNKPPVPPQERRGYYSQEQQYPPRY
jgi:hypothetical protein